MKRMFASPLLSVTLLATWLLLNNTLQPGHVVLGAVLAVLVPIFTAGTRSERRQPGPRRLVRATAAFRLGLRVLGDIVVANVEVARRILGPESALRPAFVWVPLDITDPRGVAALLAVVTLTPGTVSADLSADRRRLLVHGLHVADADALIAEVKQRYEAPLLEIFP